MKRPQVKLSACRECADPIVFARLDTGKLIPLNPVPDPVRGNVACRVAGGRLSGFVISRDRLAGPLDWRMVPHFSTCEKRKAKAAAHQPREPDPALF